MIACPTCRLRHSQVLADKAEVNRLARLMAKSDRNTHRLAPQLVAAKANLLSNLQAQSDHEAECEVAA